MILNQIPAETVGLLHALELQKNGTLKSFARTVTEFSPKRVVKSAKTFMFTGSDAQRIGYNGKVQSYTEKLRVEVKDDKQVIAIYYWSKDESNETLHSQVLTVEGTKGSYVIKDGKITVKQDFAYRKGKIFAVKETPIVSKGL